MNHPLAWTAPQPFWAGRAPSASAPQGRLSQPQILRFAHDEFIEELLATLQRDPAALVQYAATPETWRGPGTAPRYDPARWLERTPSKLLGLQRKARARQRAGAAPALPVPEPTIPLKLYQPAHLRHYLVSGSLVCQAPGLPDRHIDPARHAVSFVMRRLMPKDLGSGVPTYDPVANPEKFTECAYVPQGKTSQWVPAPVLGARGASFTGTASGLGWGEERLPMFPATCRPDDGTQRRLFIGSVPTGKREAYQAATFSNTPPTPQVDPTRAPGPTTQEARAAAIEAQVGLLMTQVIGPWAALVNSAMRNGPGHVDISDADALKAAVLAARPDTVFPNTGPDKSADRTSKTPDPDALRTLRSSLQTASWYLLLDLVLFFKSQMPAFWAELQAGHAARPGRAALLDALDAAAMPPGLVTRADSSPATLADLTPDHCSLADLETGYAGHIKTSLLEALLAAAKPEFEHKLENVSGAFKLPGGGTPPADWPDFLFLFADPWFGVLMPPLAAGFAPPAHDYVAEKIQAAIRDLGRLVADALAEEPTVPERLPDPALMLRQPADLREAWYVMRLAYERPDCAPFEGMVMSAPTRPFQMAGFFDPDAPARPIRIGLPLDISPAGLRKFDKNTVFMLSDMVCGQFDRLKGITFGDLVLSVLPWPFHKDLDASAPSKGDCSGGVMCSLSIPIITICALILLFIIVALLELVFHWLPWFVVCLPIPGFKGRAQRPGG